MITDSQTLEKKYHAKADVVVIGTGAGGAPVAYRLASAGFKVIVLEEGKRNKQSGFGKDIWKAANSMYRDAMTTITLGAPAIPVPLGRTLGGTTTVNSGTCFRTPEKIFSQWKEEFGLDGFGYNSLLPHFELIEEMLQVKEVPFELMGSNNTLFAKGAEKLNLHGKPLKRNSSGCSGSGICVFGCPENAKLSMENTFIPAASEAGAAFITSARVDKIITEKGRAKGVKGFFLNEEKKKSGEFRIEADIVVVSCGAIYTPHLLLKNGIANSSGQVGKNLRIHPAAKVIGIFEEKVNSWLGVPQAFYVDDYAGEGIMFEGFFLPPAFLSFTLPAYGKKLKEYMADYSRMAGFGVMVSDTSRGMVTRSIDSGPLIFYSVNAYDTRKFVKGIEIAARVYFEAGAKKILLPLLDFGEVTSPEELNKIQEADIKPSHLELSAFHPMGTCRMGDNPRKSVVNPYLETHDVEGLYIADASVFPSSLGVNPQESIMAFSLWCADNIARKAQ